MLPQASPHPHAHHPPPAYLPRACVPRSFSSGGVGMVDTYKAFHALVEDLPLADRAALFHGTAERFYGIDKL
jgi:hypothetical protein